MKDQLYTANALQANRVAAMFRVAFATKKVGDASVEISEPEESTYNGALALQHVTLRAPNGLGLVVGSVNAITRVGELRSYAAVVRMHKDRFKLPPAFDAEMYRTFLDDATAVLKEQGVNVSVTSSETALDDDAAAHSPAAASAAGWSQKTKAPIVIVIAVALALGVGAALMWLAR